MRALALRLAAWILAGLVVFPAVAGAREIWRSGDAFVEFAGTLRQIVRTSEQTDEDDFRDALRSGDPNCIPPGLAQPPLLPAGNFEDCVAFGEVGEERAVQSLSRLRLEIDVGVTSWLTGHVVADNELFAGDLDTLEATLGDDLSSDSFFGAEDNVTQNDHAAWRTLLYRGYLRAELGPTEWIVGRQRIAWGVGRLWNPIDRFNPIPPLAIEGDQSEGIDAVLARWNFDGFNAVEAIYAPGSSQDDARYALRVLGVTLDTDWSVMAGVFERAPTVGFDLARNLGDAAIRFEVVYADPTQNYTPLGAGSSQEQGDFWQVVGSIDYTLDLGSGLYLLLEHLYNGNALGFGRGRAGALLPLIQDDGNVGREIFGGSQLFTSARHLTGAQVGYDLLSELRGELLGIMDWNGESAVFYPTLTYSPVDFMDLRVGAQISVGPRLSQYGDVGDVGFLQADFYF